jgi:hypothetical protein
MRKAKFASSSGRTLRICGIPRTACGWPDAKKRETRLPYRNSQRVSTFTPSHKGERTKAHQMNYDKIKATILLR